MLIPRVSAALVRFLAPVSTSTDQPQSSQPFFKKTDKKQRDKDAKQESSSGSDSGSHSFGKGSESLHQKSNSSSQLAPDALPGNSEDEAPSLKVSGTEDSTRSRRLQLVSSQEERQTPDSPSTPKGAAADPQSSSFLQLFSLFQNQRAQLQRKSAHMGYQTSIRNQKKSGRFSKGAILDTKVE